LLTKDYTKIFGKKVEYYYRGGRGHELVKKRNIFRDKAMFAESLAKFAASQAWFICISERI
jgi:hypothetical protein